MYYASPGIYRMRLHFLGSEIVLSAENAEANRQSAPSALPAISDTEFEELAGLRKAQAWGAPIFRSGHPNHADALARIEELETKERAAAVEGGLPSWRVYK